MEQQTLEHKVAFFEFALAQIRQAQKNTTPEQKRLGALDALTPSPTRRKGSKLQRWAPREFSPQELRDGRKPAEVDAAEASKRRIRTAVLPA